ncbi:MAG: hypothetical protein ACTSPA_14770 [Promethearchaeota archaeon]
MKKTYIKEQDKNAKNLKSKVEEIKGTTIVYPSPISDSASIIRRKKIRYIEKHYKDVWKVINTQPIEFFDEILISFKGNGSVYLHFNEKLKYEFYVSDLRNSRIGFGFWLETDRYSVAPDLYEVEQTFKSYVKNEQIDQIYNIFASILERERLSRNNTGFEYLLKKYLDLSEEISMGFVNPQREKLLEELFNKIQNWTP